MSRRVGATAALVAALWISAAGQDANRVDAALERAALAWNTGDYIAALTAYQDLLAGPNASQALEAIALQTGELYQSLELTNDGANPVFSPDGRRFSFETGSGIVAGEASGVERVTHVRTIDLPSTDLTALAGGSATFCPDGRHVAWLRVSPSTEIAQAQSALNNQTGSERTQRQLALNRLIAHDARIMLRDLDSGHDEELQTGDLYKTGILCGVNRSVFFAGAGANETTATQIYSVTAGSTPEAVTQGDGFKVPSSIDATGRVLLFLVPRVGPFRSGTPAAQTPGAAGDAGGSRGAGGGGANVAPTSFGVLVGGRASLIRGSAPALSRNGRAVAWIERAAPAAGEQRLMTASTDDPGSPVVLHKGTERLDAPAISADGSRVAFQMMPREDWEIYLIARDGDSEMRVTREIQHDILPQFLTDTRLLGAIGEPRHRRSYLYDVPSMKRTRLFHNNTVRTIAPEYSWVPNADGTRILIVAERDGDTVSPERGVYLMDLTNTVSLQDVRARVAENLRAERALRENGRRTFAPIADEVKKIIATVSPARAYAHEKALFDFDSKHISQPGNRLASEYLFNAYKSFGYEPEYQWFAPRTALGGRTANVIARLPGTVNPDLVYVVSSHYDSVVAGPGADDDTSGTAALLETARALAGHPMPATIIFASFTGEEAGLLGSREFVRRAVADKMKIVGALNNDMIGWVNDDRLDDTIRYSNPGIRDVQHGAAIEFTNLITYDALYYKGTDAAAFFEAYGDIAGGIGSYPVLGNPHYHQSHDLLEGINHQLIAEVAKTTVATLMLLASSPSRIAGLQATANGGVARMSWTAAPETAITGYLVTWGPADNPSLHTTRVQKPEATLSGAPAGTRVRVKAVNGKGMEGWDWARAVVK
jgi:Tol biopolymer transport system component